jgi:hypothetical protein
MYHVPDARVRVDAKGKAVAHFAQASITQFVLSASDPERYVAALGGCRSRFAQTMANVIRLSPAVGFQFEVRRIRDELPIGAF